MNHNTQERKNMAYLHDCPEVNHEVMPNRICLIILVFFILSPFMPVWNHNDAHAALYKYTDKNGNVVFTDTPRPNADDIKVVHSDKQRLGGLSGFIDIEKMLHAKFSPGSEVEKASLSTVTIKTSIGYGSGFFITERCHILTNKHVLRWNEEQIKNADESVENSDSQVRNYTAMFDAEANYLKKAKSELEEYRRSIERINDREGQAQAMQNYQRRYAQLEAQEERFRIRQNEFESQKHKYEEQRSAYMSKVRSSPQDKLFTIVLKDSTELAAALVAVSSQQDLALLKVDSCTSPFIPSGSQNRISQGMTVYAIGSPVGISDSVSAGVISGYNNDYIRTDAKIYPGNSGGPLITGDGKVIGINTLKVITRQFEGLGFAIQVRKALQEFKAYLGN